MARLRPEESVAFPLVQRNLQKQGLNANEVKTTALALMETFLPLPRPKRALYPSQALWSVLVYASANASSLEEAAKTLKQAPCSNTVRSCLLLLSFPEGEEAINAALASLLPKSWLKKPKEIAVDIKAFPYYGQRTDENEDFLWRRKAEKGTNLFFFVMSLCFLCKRARYTVALKMVRRGEGILAALEFVLQRFLALGGKIKCLYLDKGFYRLEVLKRLKEMDIPFCMAARRGERIEKLWEEEGVGLHPYTVEDREKERVKVTVAIVEKNLKGRWGRKGRVFFPYVVNKLPFPFKACYERYRRRFGIESSYREMGEGLAMTTSRRMVVRVLLVGLGMVLRNLWLFLREGILKGMGRVYHHRFSFRRVLGMLRRGLEVKFGFVDEIVLEGGGFG